MPLPLVTIVSVLFDLFAKHALQNDDIIFWEQLWNDAETFSTYVCFVNVVNCYVCICRKHKYNKYEKQKETHVNETRLKIEGEPEGNHTQFLKLSFILLKFMEGLGVFSGCQDQSVWSGSFHFIATIVGVIILCYHLLA
jgi:hypothetical protein